MSMSTGILTSSDRAAMRALELLEGEPGEPFTTVRAALIVESELLPMTLDCSLYRLQRDGWIFREARPGHGTTITILRRLAA